MSIGLIEELLKESIEVKSAILSDKELKEQIYVSGRRIIDCLRAGGTIYSCGNGGSTCDSMHFTEELVARYKRDRKGLKAMHFMDPSVITCWGNDKDFKDAFARTAETFCTEKDILVAISTSGQSPNILNAVNAAKAKKSYCIGLTGKGGGGLARLCDLAITIPKATSAERIQEAHITVIHIWCEMIDIEFTAPLRIKCGI